MSTEITYVMGDATHTVKTEDVELVEVLRLLIQFHKDSCGVDLIQAAHAQVVAISKLIQLRNTPSGGNNGC